MRVTHARQAKDEVRVLAAGDARVLRGVRIDLKTFATTLRRLWGRVKKRTKKLARRGTVNRGTIETKEIGSC
jgi:hypothetical protein